MKRTLPLGAATALALVLALGVARASDRDVVVSAMVDDLQRLQVKIAAGDKAAFAAERDRLRAIGAAIVAASPDTWKAKSETDALVAYTLGGGQPRDVAPLLEKGVVPASEEPFVRGAVAYALGRERDAQTLLGAIDPRRLSLRLGGQVAFAQSFLQTERDPKKAIALLDLARLLSPGGLVEEAALRREVQLAQEQRDGDLVALLARQYISRFGHSLYGATFLPDLATGAARLGLTDDMPGFARFGPVLEAAPPADDRAFLLTIARAEVIKGKFDVAASAAREALTESPKDSAEEARARLYDAAARIVSTDYETSFDILKTIDRSRLGKPDLNLLTAVLYVASHLRDEPPAEAVARGAPDPLTDTAATPESGAALATIKLAEAALERTEPLSDAAKPAP